MRTITLQDKASSPNTELRLTVDEDGETGGERWRELRAPKLPPRRTQGELTVAEQDPLVDFTWAQDDWSDGALRPYYREGDRRYARAQGVDARWEGVLSLGMKSEDMDFLIRGMGAENTADDNEWTVSGTSGTLTRDSTVYNEGSYSYKYVVTTSSGEDSFLYQDLTNYAKYQGRELIVGVWVKTGTLGSSYAPNIYINDGVGTTSGTAITASDTDWSFISATRTINGSATRVRIMVGDDDTASGSTACTFYFDSFSIQVEGTDDEVVAGMATKAGSLYMAVGRVVAKWDENNDVWDAVYIDDGADATAIIHFDNNIYVAFGYGSEYIYGADTSWTASTLSSAIKYAKYFTVARNNAGNLALWKTETANTVKSSTDPSNSGSWSSAYTIGSVDRTITGLHSAFDTLLIGKEDGLWVYNRVYAGTATSENAFAPVSTEWDKGVNTTNFSIGEEWHGFFYTMAATQSLIRWSPGQVQDLTSLLLSPRVEGFGGEIKSIVASPHELWLAADIPESSEAGVFGDFPIDLTSTTKKIKIMSVRQDAQGGFNLHTIDEVTFGEVDEMFIQTYTTTGARFLVVSGRLNRAGTGADHTKVVRWELPLRSPAPFIDAETTVGKSGSFFTSTWHGGVPGTNKAFLKAVFWMDNLGGANTNTITVKYGLDGGDLSYTLGTMGSSSTDAVQTLYFNDATVSGSAITPTTQAVGSSIQMQFDFSTTSDQAGSNPPRMYAFEIHSTLRPVKLKLWEVFVRIGEDLIQESGYYNPVSKTKQLSDLDTLEDQVYPVYFKHTYDGHAGIDEESSTSVHIVDRERVSMGDEFEVHRLILQEADTSA